MGKSLNLKFPGVSFEAGLRKMLATPPPPSARSSKRATVKPRRKKIKTYI
jgi:hypothetical protein